jgi:hypothetical protein
VIDGALYPDARTAVEMREPATQLTLVIEGTSNPQFTVRLIPKLISKPLQEIIDIPEVRQTFDRLYALHLETIDIIRSRAELKNGVLFFAVADQNFEGFNKFIPYYLFPGAVYSVALSRSQARIKIGVGSNPWNATPKTANLASICERYGGGGHAKVAAISLPPTDFARARKVGDEIVSDLRSRLAESGVR